MSSGFAPPYPMNPRQARESARTQGIIGGLGRIASVFEERESLQKLKEYGAREYGIDPNDPGYGNPLTTRDMFARAQARKRSRDMLGLLGAAQPNPSSPYAGPAEQAGFFGGMPSPGALSVSPPSAPPPRFGDTTGLDVPTDPGIALPRAPAGTTTQAAPPPSAAPAAAGGLPAASAFTMPTRADLLRRAAAMNRLDPEALTAALGMLPGEMTPLQQAQMEEARARAAATWAEAGRPPPPTSDEVYRREREYDRLHGIGDFAPPKAGNADDERLSSEQAAAWQLPPSWVGIFTVGQARARAAELKIGVPAVAPTPKGDDQMVPDDVAAAAEAQMKLAPGALHGKTYRAVKLIGGDPLLNQLRQLEVTLKEMQVGEHESPAFKEAKQRYDDLLKKRENRAQAMLHQSAIGNGAGAAALDKDIAAAKAAMDAARGAPAAGALGSVPPPPGGGGRPAAPEGMHYNEKGLLVDDE